MAVTKYDYTKEAALDRLEQEIQDSSIVTALDHIELNDTDDLDIYFKDALSTGDKTTLDGLVSSHVNTPLEYNQVVEISGPAETAALPHPQNYHFRGTATHDFQPTANSTTDHDFTMPEERFVTGVEYCAIDPTPGDKVTFQVVHPVAGVVEEFAPSWFVFDGKSQILLYRAKVPAGLYIRVKYENVHASNVPRFLMNSFLHKRIDP